MTVENSFVTEVMGLFAQTGDVSSRKMFGGVGIFHGGLMFALIADNELYLKADKHNVHLFEQADFSPFSYKKANGKIFQMSYYLAPESFYEDADETQRWTELAQQAANRAPRKPTKKNIND